MRPNEFRERIAYDEHRQAFLAHTGLPAMYWQTLITSNGYILTGTHSATACAWLIQRVSRVHVIVRNAAVAPGERSERARELEQCRSRYGVTIVLWPENDLGYVFVNMELIDAAQLDQFALFVVDCVLGDQW